MWWVKVVEESQTVDVTHNKHSGPELDFNPSVEKRDAKPGDIKGNDQTWILRVDGWKSTLIVKFMWSPEQQAAGASAANGDQPEKLVRISLSC